jgi:hypothetical protein
LHLALGANAQALLFNRGGHCRAGQQNSTLTRLGQAPGNQQADRPCAKHNYCHA